MKIIYTIGVFHHNIYINVLASDVAEPGGFFFIGKIGKNLFA
jgi:hypothetical protein